MAKPGRLEMNESKELMLKLVAVCEKFWLERQALTCLLDSAHVPGWKAMYEKMLADPGIQKTAHEQFRAVYERVEREADADKAIQELIRVLPKTDKMN